MSFNTALIEENKNLFNKYFGGTGDIKHFYSPGRVNIIGEHLDYNGGFVFPAAISIGIHGLVRFNDENHVRMKSTNFDTEFMIDYTKPISNDGTDNWGNYPAGVIQYLMNEGKEPVGADILFFSTLPQGSGLSSSASIEVLTAYIMTYRDIKNDGDRIHLAELCKNVENQFIGVQCGIMDQFAVAMGKKDHAILLNSETLEYKLTPLVLRDHRLIIMNTNKPRKLSDSKYNERRSECLQALGHIGRNREIKNLTEATLEEANNLDETNLQKRARHVISENGRVLKSVKLLEDNNILEFGKLMTESHMSLKDNYEVSGDELDAMVLSALDTDGCIGARMTGAGFGGCAIALVENNKIDAFETGVGDKYNKKTGLKAEFYETEISDGVNIIE